MNSLHSPLVLLLLAAWLPFSSPAAGKPNILYIFTNDQSFRTVSCYPGAYNYAHTPNIDRLAKTGIRFDQAYIGAKCVPSRAGMLTGRFQYACAEGPKYKWWTTALRKTGYHTGMIGKWHWSKGAEAHQHGTAWGWSVVWDHGQYAKAGGYYYDQKVKRQNLALRRRHQIATHRFLPKTLPAGRGLQKPGQRDGPRPDLPRPGRRGTRPNAARSGYDSPA